MSNFTMLAFTSDYKILTTSYSSASIHLGGISISQPLAVSFIITVAITAILYWFLMKTESLDRRSGSRRLKRTQV